MSPFETKSSAHSHAIPVMRLDHIALRVVDMARAVAWYCEVLGFEQRYADVWDRPVMLMAGDAGIALFDADPHALPSSGNVGLSHFALHVSRRAFTDAQAYFTTNNIAFTYEDHVVCHSLYLHDPDGYRVELTTYEGCEH